MEIKLSYTIDVLCVGAGTYDLVYSVDHHPEPDEKIRATSFIGCGGGPAANGAVTVARFGLKSAFVGYLGYDIFGEAHFAELQQAGVLTDYVARGDYSSALSVVIVKPDGSRALVNYRKAESFLAAGSVDFSTIGAKVILFDGHEPHISPDLARSARQRNIITVLDAGSIHSGTEELASLVDYLVCSEKFGLGFSGEKTEDKAVEKLSSYAPNVIITVGDRGLVWKNQEGSGRQEGRIRSNLLTRQAPATSFMECWRPAWLRKKTGLTVSDMQVRPEHSAARKPAHGWEFPPNRRSKSFSQHKSRSPGTASRNCREACFY